MIWLSFEEAARLLGIKRRRLSELIRRRKITTRPGKKAANGKPNPEVQLESLPHEAQARYFAPHFFLLGREGETKNGKAPFRADSDVTSIASPSAVSPLVGLQEEELAKLNTKADILRGPGGVQSKAGTLGWSTRTVRRKLKALAAYGIAGLLRKTPVTAGVSRVADQKVIALIKNHFLQPHRPSIADVHREVSKEYLLSGLPPPSYSFVRRVAQEIPPDLVARFRIGEKEFDDKIAYVSLREKPDQPRLWVDMDHHPCDHQVVFPDGSIGRPWITAAQDICTNEILGFYVTPEKPYGKGTFPGSGAIAICLRRAILRKKDPAWPSRGLFENLYVDLGKDFRSEHVRAVCNDLGINIVPTRGYHGKSKPIERWFGVMENGMRHLPGFVGSKPEDNPERQRIKPEPLNPAKLLSIDEYEAELEKWIIAEFHHRESKALKGRSPLQALQEHAKSGFSPREVRNERALDLLLMRRATRVVRNLGIAIFGTGSRQRFFMAEELLPLIRQRVDVHYDPSNLGEIVVYQGARFICKATNKELLHYGASQDTLARERELKRLQKQKIDERIEELQREAQYPNPLARAAAEKRYENVLDEEHKKIAAGIESGGVPVLIPKYARAAKRLRAVKPTPAREGLSVDSNKYLQEGPEAPEACHVCGERTRNLSHCFDCLYKREEKYCSKCGGSGAHRYCSNHNEGHDHTNPGVCHECGAAGHRLTESEHCLTTRGLTGKSDRVCSICHGTVFHRFCEECRKHPDHRPINKADRLPTSAEIFRREANPYLEDDDV